MAYTCGYSKLFSTADKERSKSQKRQSDFSLVFSVNVAQTIENEIRFAIVIRTKPNQKPIEPNQIQSFDWFGNETFFCEFD